MAAAAAVADPGWRRAHLPRVDGARPDPAHGRRAPLGDRLRGRGADRAPRAGLDEVVGTGPADDDLAGWLGQGCADLVAALAAAPDDLQCWTFLAAPSPRAMWARRQAHETAIHRVDAQLAAGIPVTACTPAFAADGIDELLVLFVPRRGSKLRADPPASLAVRCTDVDASWLLRMDPDGVTTTPRASDRRRRRRGLHGQRDGRRSLPGAVEPNRCGRPDRRGRPRRAGPVLRSGADPLAVCGRISKARGDQAAGSRRRPTSQ